MIKKIAKWVGLVLLILVIAITIVTATRQNLKYDAPYPDIKASSDIAKIARGRAIIFGAAHCVDCHNGGNVDSLLKLGLPVNLKGGVLFDLPVGKIYSKNITPDKETGIGRFSDREIARALRYGVHPDGTAVYDFMQFHNMSDEDLTAIISYLRAQQPVRNKVPDNELNLLGNMVKAFMVKPVGPAGEVPKAVQIDTTAQYGRYIAMNIAECNGCHTLRDMSGAFIGEPFAGGGQMEYDLVPPNLTTDSSSRIFGWKQEDFVHRFRQGKIIPYSPMPWNSFKRMSDTELIAVYKFLKSLKPAKNDAQQQLAEN